MSGKWEHVSKIGRRIRLQCLHRVDRISTDAEKGSADNLTEESVLSFDAREYLMRNNEGSFLESFGIRQHDTFVP